MTAACGSHTSAGSPSVPASTPPTIYPGDPTVWLCFPGTAHDPCTNNLDTTVIQPNGKRTVDHASPAANPPVDCFYVYPTVSTQQTPNANLTIDPEETNVAVLQASRFSLDCRVYAPMYRQLTLMDIFKGFQGGNQQEAYADVLNAWNDYLDHYNHGRGVVLIGHSQGALMLETLMATDIDTKPDELSRIVSAVILGGDVLVPTTDQSASSNSSIIRPRGTTFTNVPPCHSAIQTQCVIAFSSFDTIPPPGAFFGRSANAGTEVLCVNPSDPAAPTGAARPVTPYLSLHDIRALGGTSGVGITTGWVAFPGVFTAACEYADSASWLQINGPSSPEGAGPYLTNPLGPTWGLHLVDVNIALGNLVTLVHEEAGAWMAHHWKP